jgi:hypothetical protein
VLAVSPSVNWFVTGLRSQQKIYQASSFSKGIGSFTRVYLLD